MQARSGGSAFFLGNAMDVAMDATGRVLILARLRAGRRLLGSGVAGHGQLLELWDKATHDAKGSPPPCRRHARHLQRFSF